MTACCVYLWILRSFSDHLLYRAPLGNCLFRLQVAEFQPPHTVKKDFTSAFKLFRTSSLIHFYLHTHDYFFQKALKVCEINVFRWKIVIYLFNYDFSESTFFMLKMFSIMVMIILFWYLYQIHIFNNNLNDEEMITSHLMCKSNRKILAKHVYA